MVWLLHKMELDLRSVANLADRFYTVRCNVIAECVLISLLFAAAVTLPNHCAAAWRVDRATGRSKHCPVLTACPTSVRNNGGERRTSLQLTYLIRLKNGLMHLLR